jgi:hypothetical protein
MINDEVRYVYFNGNFNFQLPLIASEGPKQAIGKNIKLIKKQ